MLFYIEAALVALELYYMEYGILKIIQRLLLTKIGRDSVKLIDLYGKFRYIPRIVPHRAKLIRDSFVVFPGIDTYE